MRALLLLPILVGACASPDVEKMSTLDVCYLGLSERGKQAIAAAELQRRNADCRDHAGELAQITVEQWRARGGNLKAPLSIAPKTSSY